MRRIGARILWVVHLLLLVSACLWIACDPWFELMFGYFRSGIASPIDAFGEAVAQAGQIRCVIFVVCVGLITSFVVLTLAGMLRKSSKRQRSLKAWLMLTAVVASWCGLVINLPSIAWQGKRIQFAIQIDEFESLVQPLRTNWPSVDGELAGVGPFMAYPFGNPSTLVLLAPPDVSNGSLFVSAVERDASGTIRLELSGIHSGDFVEWHTKGSKPSSFSGGLNVHYELQSSVSLGSDWYLARYRQNE
ncbi:MAG: hypothetical protein AAF802_23685 [Planctomycetota bacterium]